MNKILDSKENLILVQMQKKNQKKLKIQKFNKKDAT